MGAYLSKPICDKESEDYAGDIMRVGASAMQGWRMSQEDAHCSLLEFDGDTNTSLFAVYDGHGGCDVAKYTAANFPEFLKSVPAYKEGRLATALEDAFLGFDATLVQNDVKLQLAQLAAGTDGVDEDQDNEEENKEEAKVLREEATMPIEQLLERYGGGGVLGSHVIAGLKKPTKNLSPVVRAKPGSGAEDVNTDAGGNTETGSDDGVRVKLADKIVNGFREDEVDDAADDPASTSDSPATKTVSKPLPSSDAVGSTDPTVVTALVANGNGKPDSVADGCDKLSGNVAPSQPAEGSEAEAAEPANGSGSAESANCSAIDTRHKAETELAPEACSSSGNIGSSSGNTNIGSSSGNIGSSSNVGSSSASSSNTSVCESGAASSSSCSTAAKEATDPCSSTSSTSCDVPSGPCSSSTGAAGGSSCTAGGSDDSVPSSSAGPSCAGPSSSKPTESSEDETSEEEEGDSDDELEEWNADAADSDSDEDDEEAVDDDDEDAEDDEDEDDAEEVEPGMEFGDEPGTDSGCTAVVALLRDNELHVANAGDSRCVLCRDGKAVEMSVDHKPEDAIEHERILKAGGRVTCDGRVNGGLNLSRAIGDHAYKKNTLISDREQMITALPDVKSLVIDGRDEFMVLACDGIWNVMSSQDVVNFVRTRIQSGTTKLSAICEEMFDFCLAPDTSGDGTGCDNMTCVIVSFRGLTSGVATRPRNKRKTSDDDNNTATAATDGVADESTVAAKRLKDGD